MNDMEATNKVDLVRKLVDRGHGEEIRHILLGVSKHSSLTAGPRRAYPTEFENRDAKGFHLMTWVCAHLEFTTKYGCTAKEAKDGRRLHFSHHSEYEAWLLHGAPGILLEELEHLAKIALLPRENQE